MSEREPWWYRAMPAQRIAVLRCLVGGYALIYLVARLPHLTGVTRFDHGQFRPVGPVSLLGDPLPHVAVWLVALTAVLFGCAFVLGWRFRTTGPIFGVLLLWVISYRNSWGMVFHTENLLVVHVLVLGLASSADAYALDSPPRASPVDGRYGWPVRLLCAVTVATYVLAGIAKLKAGGLEWVTSDTLRNFVAYDNLRKAELGASYSTLGAFAVRYDWLFPPLAGLSLLVELGAPVALLGRRIGMAWCALAWSFHLGVLVMMAILFHYPLLGVAYASFFPVETLGERIHGFVRRARA